MSLEVLGHAKKYRNYRHKKSSKTFYNLDKLKSKKQTMVFLFFLIRVKTHFSIFRKKFRQKFEKLKMTEDRVQGYGK